MFNVDDFINDLNESITKMEAEELNINITGDEETDREIIQNPQQANYFCKLVSDLKAERDKVKHISTDFYSGYIFLAKKLFKNVEI